MKVWKRAFLRLESKERIEVYSTKSGLFWVDTEEYSLLNALTGYRSGRVYYFEFLTEDYPRIIKLIEI